jgi:prolyl 4-hydroxylase
MGQLQYSSSVFFFFVALLLPNVFASARGVQQALLSDSTCKHPPYTIHIFSKTPLVIYISNFLTLEERTHLQEIT